MVFKKIIVAVICGSALLATDVSMASVSCARDKNQMMQQVKSGQTVVTKNCPAHKGLGFFTLSDPFRYLGRCFALCAYVDGTIKNCGWNVGQWSDNLSC